MDINSIELNNPTDLGHDVSGIDHHGTENFEFQLAYLQEIDDAKSLIRQAYLLTRAADSSRLVEACANAGVDRMALYPENLTADFLT